MHVIGYHPSCRPLKAIHVSQVFVRRYDSSKRDSESMPWHCDESDTSAVMQLTGPGTGDLIVDQASQSGASLAKHPGQPETQTTEYACGLTVGRLALLDNQCRHHTRGPVGEQAHRGNTARWSLVVFYGYY